MSARRTAGVLSSFVIAASSAFVLTTNAFGDLAHPTRFTAVLVIFIVIHALRYLRLWISREVALYLLFVGYIFLSLLWTVDMKTASATLPSIFNCLLIVILFSALASYHELRALLMGLASGFLAAAGVYTLTTGFPLHYPEDFSYNSIAGMYLFGLFIIVTLGAFMRWTILPLCLGAILLVLIAATTSIKTNLGIGLGIMMATLLYFRATAWGIFRNLIVVGILAGGIAYALASNQALNERVQTGLARVSNGLAILTNREGDSGGTSLGMRQGWKKEGLKGWAASPLFGHGVEAFRADFGITSHSTPIDLLYNGGLIAFGLFYSIFVSIALRLYRAHDVRRRGVRARIAACLICYMFISISGLIYYDAFVAMFVALSTGLLMRSERRADGEAISEKSIDGDARASISAA